MSHHAGILQEWVLALENMKIRTADADASWTNQGSGRIRLWPRAPHQLQLAGLRTDKGIYLLHATT
jgi:hypothetical protein